MDLSLSECQLISLSGSPGTSSGELPAPDRPPALLQQSLALHGALRAGLHHGQARPQGPHGAGGRGPGH